MRIFLDKRVKQLLGSLWIIRLIFLLALIFEKTRFYIVILYLLVCFLSDYLLYRYFKDKDRSMSQAISGIQDYINDDKREGLDCYEEGQLNRLFHEVNSLIGILNAHRDKEEKTKEFLRDSILDISHQIKTPIAALSIYNGIIQDEAEEGSVSQEFAKMSEEELDRINILLKNLLTMARFDTDTMLMDKKWENLWDILLDIKDKFNYREIREGKKIKLSGSKDISLYCDRLWISEAFGNIVKNALDHTGEGDLIEIDFKHFGSLIQVRIKDSGSGIHTEDINHIFKRFYRSRFSKNTQGVGLGLALSKAVVEAHAGSIEVESEISGGTCFIINFLIPTKL